MKADTAASGTAPFWTNAHKALGPVLGYGLLANLLLFMPTVYMLEVYDRVLNSGSANTLLSLTALAVVVYAALSVIDWVRSEMLYGMGRQAEADWAPTLYERYFAAQLARTPLADLASLQDLASLRTFAGSSTMVAILDTPFALMVLFVLLAIHPWLAATTLLAAVLIAASAVLTDRSSRLPLAQANTHLHQAQQAAGSGLRSAVVVQAMGMGHAMAQRWQTHHQAYLDMQATASVHAGRGVAFSKCVQTLQSSLLLGLGCWLTLDGKMSASGSMMIVASVLGGRAISPLSQVVMQWRQIMQMRLLWRKLEKTLATATPPKPSLNLPAPQGHLSVEQVSYGLPGASQFLIRNLQIDLQPGMLAVVMGPSGAGKTTIARLLVGILPASQGKVRLDTADLYTWDKQALGPHIGYLPQNIELLDGTVAQNITRFGPTDEALLRQAVALAGLTPWVSRWPLGLDHAIGVEGGHVSGGMRQRIGLARAVYGNPRLVVLDEPNSHLDEDGEKALMACLAQLKQRQTTTVVISHRQSVLQMATHMVVVRDGVMQAFGERDQVIAALQKAYAQQQQAGKA
jgi:ATP-binding cassette subfamily C exporter for protease/lipase